MNKRDQYELLWWREVFAPRFIAGELPEVGTPLFGHQLLVFVRDGEALAAWSNKEALVPAEEGGAA